MSGSRFGVLVLDFDGTIAEHGVLNPEVRAAIQEARAQGIIVIIATGRILEDLRRSVGSLRFVDAVVAENGAVLAFPASGRSMLLGQAPPASFIHTLRTQGVAVSTGQCVVEADAGAAHIVLSAIREQELPLVLLFNRGRLMVLPQGISKATGLREALRSLRLSEHNAIGVGDAENDNALLAACEVGVAVDWGSSALKKSADDILAGSGPAAVAGYIRQMLAHPNWAEKAARRQVVVGYTDGGEALSLALRERNVLVAGDPRTGKSWIAGLISEQLILQGYCLCVIDPEGDYGPLQALPGVATLGGAGPVPSPYEVSRALRHPDASIVIDLSSLRHDQKRSYVSALLPLVAGLRRRSGLPHRIVLDEAHYFVQDQSPQLLRDLALQGYTLATYRLALLPPEVLAASHTAILTRLTDAQEMPAVQALAGRSTRTEDWATRLARLPLGEAVLLPTGAGSDQHLVRFRVAPRLTPHVRHRQKYLDTPVPEERAFVVTCRGKPTGAGARTLNELCAVMATSSPVVLGDHLARGDISKWVAGVFGDYFLAGRIRALEQLHRLHQGGDELDLLKQFIDERYTDSGSP
jgi:hydroxymethylpyrimidine pyrophosphatase-like HAD family hydrolase